MERQVLNISLDMAKKAKTSPLYFDLLCLSVSIKMMSGSSRYRITTLKKFMSDFGLNSNKAKQLLKAAKSENSLFRFDNKKNTLIANTYKTNRTITKDVKGRKIYQMYCMKIRISENFKIGYIKNEIRKSLVLCAVNVSLRMDKFHHRSNFTCRRSGVAFSLQNLAHIAGVTRKTVVKYISQLVEERRLVVYKGELSEIVEKVDKSTILKCRLENKHVMITRQGYGCVYHDTLYNIDDRNVNSMFGNIIYNHYKRLTFNHSPKMEDIMESERMGMFQ